MVGALIVLALVVAGLAAVEVSRVSRNIYVQITEAASRGLRDRLILFLAPPLDSLVLARGFLVQDKSADKPAAELAPLLFPALTEQPGLVAVIASNRNGPTVLLARDGDGFLGAVADAGGRLAWQRYEASREPMGPAVAKPELNRAALEALDEVRAGIGVGKPVWSRAFSLPAAKGAVLSASTFVGGQTAYMLTYVFSVGDIYQVCSRDLASRNERVLLFDAGGRVLDFGRLHAESDQDPGEPGQAQPPVAAQGDGPLFLDASRTLDPQLGRAARAWQVQGKPLARAFSYQSDGQAWWTALNQVSGGENTLYAGVAIAQSELWGEFFAGRTMIVLEILAALLVAGLLLLLLALRRRRLGQAGDDPGFFETEREVLELIAKGESDRLEFKSSLRYNYNSGKPGKEIELAAMKPLAAFMNASGGCLVVGVDDAGQVLGLDPDGFASDDHLLRHFTGLVNQHLGIECVRNMTFGVRQAQGKRILAVCCAPSDDPVYVRGGKDEEEFYMRVGPSNRKLSLSQFLAHVARRKGRGE